MSFLMIQGKRFICQECKTEARVEYVGGSQMTQIGEDNIYLQQELSQKYGVKFDDSYLVDIGVCSDCFNDEKGLKKTSIVSNLIDEITVIKQKYVTEIEDAIGSITDEIIFCMSVDELDKLYNKKLLPLLVDKHMSVSKRNKQIKAIIRQNRYEIERYIIDTALDGVFKDIVEKYNAQSSDKITELKKLLCTGDNLYFSKQTDTPENLNNYISNDYTIRYPVEESASEIFYFNIEVDTLTLFESFNLDSESYTLDTALEKLFTSTLSVIEKDESER